MFIQLALGTGLLLVSILISALSALLMEEVFSRNHSWLVREPHRPKLVLVITGVSLWVLLVVTTGVWIWAFAFWSLGAFPTLEESVYFSLVTYTTLGFGDLLLPNEWRLLAGLASTNGFLNFGMLTATFVEALRVVRLGQMAARRPRGD
ncbi:ion channel [Rhodobacter ferrooxidans]|uniref:Ion transport 2 domain protein n=1 Tax=Rhodobacter ferrooxidans TaxID=371731 RepID=C8S4E8_9RHOB|nr:ion channel [Rhodobacter sp. SW2]EEW24115.1 Ion transport 2 domain protein [Rhodobacter sp. SW2]